MRWCDEDDVGDAMLMVRWYDVLRMPPEGWILTMIDAEYFLYEEAHHQLCFFAIKIENFFAANTSGEIDIVRAIYFT